MIKLIALLAKARLSREEFATALVGNHIKLSAKMPGLRGTLSISPSTTTGR